MKNKELELLINAADALRVELSKKTSSVEQGEVYIRLATIEALIIRAVRSQIRKAA